MALVLCLLAPWAVAQNQADTLAVALPSTILKLDVYRFIGYYNTASLGLEYRLTDELFLESDLGFIYGTWSDDERNDNLFRNEEIINPRGFVVGQRIRYYFKPYSESRSFSWFVAPEVSFRYIVSEGEGFLRQNCGLNCGFFRYYDYDIRQYQYITRMRHGFQKVFDNKVAAELSWALGFLYNQVEEPGKPMPTESQSFSETLTNESVRLHVQLSLKLGWVWAKKPLRR